MIGSVGEIASLAQRAVRGAGHPWGVAEEAAWAVRWLIRAGLPGPETLAEALRADDLVALTEGIALADRGDAPDLLQPASSGLMLPFVARTAGSGQALVYAGETGRFRIWATGCDAPLPDGQLHLEGREAAPSNVPQRRAVLSAVTYEALSAFAERTYAPATEASRIRGAGAGLTDND